MITYKVVRPPAVLRTDNGYRVVHSPDEVWLSVCGDTPYRKGETVTATCHTILRTLGILPGEHTTPERDCGCGIYSVTRAGIWDALIYAQDNDAIIAVLPHGRCLTDGRVVRSESATVLGPVDIPSWLPKAARHLYRDVDDDRRWIQLRLLASLILSLRRAISDSDDPEAASRVIEALTEIRLLLRRPPLDRARKRRLIAALARRYGQAVREGAVYEAHMLNAAIRKAYGLKIASSEREGLANVLWRLKRA